MPNKLHGKFLSSQFRIRAVKSICWLLFDALQYILKSHRISIWYRTTFTPAVSAVITGIPCARNILKKQDVRLLCEIKRSFSHFILKIQSRESHFKSLLRIHLKKMLFCENLIRDPIFWSIRELD